jgi:hypothetical protein
MLDVLGKVLCAITQLPERIADWLVALVNLFIVASSSAINAVVGLLPDIPDPPTLPASADTGLGWANWFLPVGLLVTQLATVIALVVVFVGISIVLNWLKAR